MKRLIITLTSLLTISLGSMAQNNYNEICIPSSNTAQTFSRQNLVGDHPYNFYVESSSERGHDRLDSLYYLNVTTYEMPFYKEKDQQSVAPYVVSILQTYDRLMESATGGFKTDLADRTEESKRLSMYYAEGLEPFVIGGKGRSYVVVRQQDPNNINYRTCEGVEWWGEGTKKNTVIKFRVFSLYGPLTEQHYERAFNEHIGALTSEVETTNTTPSKRRRNNGEEDLIRQIKVLAELYKDNGSTTDDAVVHSINERLSDIFLNQQGSKEFAQQLFHTLGKIPGYGTVIHYSNGTVMSGNFEWCVNALPQGKVSEMNWYTKGDAKCTGDCRNFLLEIHVEE